MAPTTSFCVVVSETKSIINAHGRHFRGLFFCLLNFSFSLIIYKYPTAANLSLLPLALRLALSLFAILFSLFSFLFFLSAVSTITYSTYHGFCGRPDKLAASFKLVSPTLLPLVSTTIATQVLMFLVCASFGLFLVVVTKGAEILGFEIDYNSNYYLGFCIAVFVILVLVLVYLQVNWVLASAIVVLESKWGFEALRRSVYLVKGMRSVSLSLMLLFGSVTGLFLWVHSRITSLSLRSYPDVWESLGFVLLNFVESGFVSLIMIHNVASNTVLYMYCKALHGELALEIPEEYVSLPLDDAKLPRVVS